MVRNALLAVLVWLAVAFVPTFLFSDYHLFQLTMVVVYAIAILGPGHPDRLQRPDLAGPRRVLRDRRLRHRHPDVPSTTCPYWATLPVSAIVCAAVGFLIGLPALRLGGLYLALTTFALAVAVPQLLKHNALERWTGGVQGLVIDKPDPPFGLDLSPDQWLYLFTLFVGALLFLLAWNIVRGRIGRAMMAIRDHALAAEAMGIDIALLKTRTFALSAMYTGVAGSLGAIVVQFVAPDSFGIFVSIYFFVGLVVGGVSSIGGAIFGGLFIEFVPNLAEKVSKAAPGAVYGVILIAMMFLMPGGAAGFVGSLFARFRRGAKSGELAPANWGNRVRTLFRPRPPCLAALSLTLAVTAACKKENAYVPPPPPQVGVAKPVQQDVLPYLEVTGNAVAYNRSTSRRGCRATCRRSTTRMAREAKQADTLFVIEPAPYQAQLQQAQATLAATQADLVQAEAEFTRQSTLGKSDFASQSKVDEARAKRDSDKAKIMNNQAGVTIAAINLGYTRVTAPFDGMVTAHLVSVGGLVGVNRADQARHHRAARSDLCHLHRQRAAGAADQGSDAGSAGVKPGDIKGRPVEVGLMTEDGLSACRQARLRRTDARSIDRDADRPRRTSRTRTARCCPACSCASASHWRCEKANALLVPDEALGADQSGSYLLVVDKDNVVQQRTVQTGQLEGKLRVIASGIARRRSGGDQRQPEGNSRREGRAAGDDDHRRGEPPPPGKS